jgi:hypothetical protein
VSVEDELSSTHDEAAPDRRERVAGDRPLTLLAASEVLNDRPCIVVLVAGEANAGKTTLLGELWAQFLRGSFSGWDFAGSRTLLALSELQALARASSGRSNPDTVRTRSEEPQLLHLAVQDDYKRSELLLSDVRGEYFEPVINGQVLGDRMTLASRADRCILLLSGEDYATRGGRARTLSRARQLLGGLTVTGGLTTRIPMLLAWSKADLIEESERDNALAMLSSLANEFGAEVDATVSLIGARPEIGPQLGLDSALRWLVSADEAAGPLVALVDDHSDRMFWRASSGSQA